MLTSIQTFSEMSVIFIAPLNEVGWVQIPRQILSSYCLPGSDSEVRGWRDT